MSRLLLSLLLGLFLVNCGNDTEPKVPAIIPAVPSITATTFSSTQINLNWSTVPEAVYYRLSQAISAGGTYNEVYVGDGTSYEHAGLHTNMTYYYQLKACSNILKTSCSADSERASASTVPPAAPSSVTATAINGTQIDLSWSAVSGATYYRLSQSATPTGNYTQIYAGNGTSYAHADLSADTTYYYQLTACLNNVQASCSAASKSVSVSTALPATPSVSATASSYTKINLTWDAVATATYYRLSQSATSAGTYTQIYAGADTSYAHTDLTPGTTYHYQLKACLSNIKASCSAASPSVNATTPLPEVNLGTVTFGGSEGVPRTLTVTITIDRYDNPASVIFRTQSVTAHPGTDYTEGEVLVNFDDGETLSKTVTFSLIPNANQEDKVLYIELIFPNNLVAGSNSSKFITLGPFTRFTKLGNNGKALATQTATWDDSGTETAGTKWSCVLDNQTNQVWEVKNNVSTSVHYKDNTYPWGGKGVNTEDTNNTSGNSSDWNTLVDAANAGDGLCGYTDWKVESTQSSSLEQLVKTGANPAIDTDYFPNTVANKYWYTVAGPSTASYVDFSDGTVASSAKTDEYRVRLVRYDSAP